MEYYRFGSKSDLCGKLVVTTRLLHLAGVTGKVLAWQAAGRGFEPQSPKYFLFFSVVSDMGRCQLSVFSVSHLS